MPSFNNQREPPKIRFRSPPDKVDSKLAGRAQHQAHIDYIILYIDMSGYLYKCFKLCVPHCH